MTFAMNQNHFLFPRLRVPLRKFHNGISFFEVLYKVLKPHGITYLGDQRWLVSLWSASIYYVIDLKQQRIEMQMEDCDRRDVFSTYQYLDVKKQRPTTRRSGAWTSSTSTTRKPSDFDVPVKSRSTTGATGKIEELWSGDFDTDTHYIQLNKDKRYLGADEFRRLLRRAAQAASPRRS